MVHKYPGWREKEKNLATDNRYSSLSYLTHIQRTSLLISVKNHCTLFIKQHRVKGGVGFIIKKEIVNKTCTRPYDNDISSRH